MSFTKVAPAGIGTEPGDGITIGDSFLHTTGIDIGHNTGIGVTIRKHGDATFTGIITASAFFGDGSGLEGVSSSGIGTPLSDDDTSELNKVYYVNQELSIGSTVTVNHPDSAVTSYTHYQDLVVKDNADFIVADGDTFIPDVLGIRTSTSTASAATGGRIRAGTITNAGANGAPNFPNGLTGTAGTFSGAINAASGTITGNLGVGGVLTYEDVTNVDSVGLITARSGIRCKGSLGIGTVVTSPSTILHLDSDGTPTTIKIVSDTESSIDFDDHGGSAKRYKIGTNISANEGQFEIRDITTGAERLRIGPSGQIGIAGANYGTSGQVLTSQGSGSAVQWATPGYGVFEVKHGSSAQSIPRVTYTKVEFKTETYDLDGLFDTTTYRYTPQVAGYYYVFFTIVLTGQSSGYEIYAEIKKNGSSVMKSHSGGSQNYGSLGQADVYGFVQMNGSSDYLDSYIWHNNANSASRSPDVNYTRMGGYLVRRT